MCQIIVQHGWVISFGRLIFQYASFNNSRSLLTFSGHQLIVQQLLGVAIGVAIRGFQFIVQHLFFDVDLVDGYIIV